MRRKRVDHPRRVCFVTGSRAEFGLMGTVLEAIRRHPELELQIVVTGMHLDRTRGKTGDEVDPDAVVKWSGGSRAEATGKAIAGLAKCFAKLRPDVVLLVGDRVEAFAAAAAGHLCDVVVAHVHGGDRAMGQMDDSLRHAISKLAHVHFPATKKSAQRLAKMGEDWWRIHRVGSPGIDGIIEAAAPLPVVRKQFGELRRGRYALVILHPIEADEGAEFARASMIAEGLRKSGIERSIIIYPNNDPGAEGIIRCWKQLGDDPRFTVVANLSRGIFLGLLRDAAMLVGDSSSGIIEAASFRTPVIDVGPRQQGRERCEDVRNVPYEKRAIAGAIADVWNSGRPVRGRHANLYGGNRTGSKISHVLSGLRIDSRLLRKLIRY
jgi:GDP/UDP-N,N'-diacetylbacillosamine 2-epimerase (hydrolysing)